VQNLISSEVLTEGYRTLKSSGGEEKLLCSELSFAVTQCGIVFFLNYPSLKIKICLWKVESSITKLDMMMLIS
jgi:hypothetical protein